MGIQDDYFDVADFLENGPHVPKYVRESFEDIWDRFCIMESEIDRLQKENNELSSFVEKFKQVIRETNPFVIPDETKPL